VNKHEAEWYALYGALAIIGASFLLMWWFS